MNSKAKGSTVTVRDVMRTDFDTIDGTATIEQALQAMNHHETKALIVQQRHEGDEIGMLLISDIARVVLGKDRAPDRVNVYEVMAKPVLCIRPGMQIRYCARMLDRFDLSRAPVTENEEVIGIVSLTDLVLRGLVVE